MSEPPAQDAIRSESHALYKDRNAAMAVQAYSVPASRKVVIRGVMRIGKGVPLPPRHALRLTAIHGGILQMDDTDTAAIHRRLEKLRLEHRDLDDVIGHLSTNPDVDQLQLRRLKKRKLMLKDTIRRLESKLIPDLDA